MMIYSNNSNRKKNEGFERKNIAECSKNKVDSKERNRNVKNESTCNVRKRLCNVNRKEQKGFKTKEWQWYISMGRALPERAPKSGSKKWTICKSVLLVTNISR
jgi:uncharacterized Fe-S radical SAM superfamily protein PflX